MNDKKDMFLVARVPSSLKDKIVARAKEQKKNISKVVRDILTRAFNG